MDTYYPWNNAEDAGGQDDWWLSRLAGVPPQSNCYRLILVGALVATRSTLVGADSPGSV